MTPSAPEPHWRKVESMDPVLLSRIQFGLSVGAHYIFPTITLGLTLMILIFETQYLRKGKEVFKETSMFLIRILAVVFVVGVATGLVLAVTIGTNWSSFSRLVGHVFGPALAAEAIFAFFLESVFLGVLLFWRNRVSKRIFWLSALFVTVGAYLSGLWILIANSWMQTPAGYILASDGSIVVTDFAAAIFSPSLGIRYLHTIMGGIIGGTFLVAAVGVFYHLKGRHIEVSHTLVKYSMIVLFFSCLAMPLVGHLHSVQVANTQPEKLAAYEGLWVTQANAPLSLFGIPDDAGGVTNFYVGAPGILSFLVHFDFNAPITGLNDFAPADRPPIFLSFVTYHTMVGIGVLLAGFVLLGAFLHWRKRFWATTWYLRLAPLVMPLAILSNEIGWIAAEVGRQPWTVYHVLRTADAASKVVPAWQIMTSLVLLAAVYGFLYLLFITRLRKILREGPKRADSPTVEGGAYE